MLAYLFMPILLSNDERVGTPGKLVIYSLLDLPLEHLHLLLLLSLSKSSLRSILAVLPANVSIAEGLTLTTLLLWTLYDQNQQSLLHLSLRKCSSIPHFCPCTLS
jgi:hypothetical protein